MRNIRHTGIIVNNFDKADYFYGTLLGLQFVDEQLDNVDYAHTLLGTRCILWRKMKAKNGNLIEFYQIPNYHVEENSLNHISFTVENVEELRNVLLRNDIKCSTIQLKPKAKIIFCRDPFHNLLELVEEL